MLKFTKNLTCIRRNTTFTPEMRLYTISKFKRRLNRLRILIKMMDPELLEDVKNYEVYKVTSPVYGALRFTISKVNTDIITVFIHVENTEAGIKYLGERFDPKKSEYNFHTNEPQFRQIRRKFVRHMKRLLEHYYE